MFYDNIEQMYKVFFNDRVVFLTDGKNENFDSSDLFYPYTNRFNLRATILKFVENESLEELKIFHEKLIELQEAFVSCMHPVNAAGGVVTNKKGEFLVMFRRGVWDLPKGHVDKGESYKEAALREVEEECGIKGMKITEELSATYHTYIEKDKHKLKKTVWFRMQYDGDETPTPETKEGISEVKWVKPEELAEIKKNTWASLVDVFEAVI